MEADMGLLYFEDLCGLILVMATSNPVIALLWLKSSEDWLNCEHFYIFLCSI